MQCKESCGCWCVQDDNRKGMQIKSNDQTPLINYTPSNQ